MGIHYRIQQWAGSILWLTAVAAWTFEGGDADVKQTWMALRGIGESKEIRGRVLRETHSTHHRHGVDFTQYEPTIVNEHAHNCNAVAQLDRLVMVAGEKYDLSWLHELSLPYVRYQSSDTQKPHYYANHANEAGAYLSFIVDYYECLPKAVAFIHGHDGEGWHNHDMRQTLLNINWEAVHFSDLNIKPGVWEQELADATARPRKQVATGNDVYNGTFNIHQVIDGVAYDLREADLWLTGQQFNRMYDQHFGPQGLGPMPGRLKYSCCAQFVVQSDAIRLRPRSFYEKTLEYVADNDIQGNTHVDGKFVLGDGIGLFWGMVFGHAEIEAAKDCTEYAADILPARCLFV